MQHGPLHTFYDLGLCVFYCDRIIITSSCGGDMISDTGYDCGPVPCGSGTINLKVCVEILHKTSHFYVIRGRFYSPLNQGSINLKRIKLPQGFCDFLISVCGPVLLRGCAKWRASCTYTPTEAPWYLCCICALAAIFQWVHHTFPYVDEGWHWAITHLPSAALE